MTIYRNLSYLEKSRYGEAFDLPPAPPKLRYIFVQPYQIAPSSLSTLASLNESLPSDIQAEFYLVVNEKESQEAKLQSNKARNQLIEAGVNKLGLPFQVHLLESFNIPSKKLTQGLAMKIGMDQALERFHQNEIKNGWIVPLAPDVELPPAFLSNLHHYVDKKPKKSAIGFGFKVRDIADAQDKAIQELSQRYIIEGLRFAEHPHAYYTLGDTFACKSSFYEKFGGINQKFRGATFNFLQKFISEGQFKELPSLPVKLPPSTHLPRIFSGVILPSSMLFLEIKELLHHLPAIRLGEFIELPTALSAFLKEHDFSSKLEEMQKHSSSFESFQKRFYSWFSLERVASFLQSGQSYHPAKGTLDSCLDLFTLIGIEHPETISLESLLNRLRDFHYPYKSKIR
ncbi:MAG: hypothetical protein MRZ79_09590 [Bacteroidia bacterium]|nr:hypothetical protein [Bacteroidia bacterium]